MGKSKKKSWSEKLRDSKDLPKVIRLTGKMRTKFGGGTMVIPAPKEVDAIMQRVPRGKLITINEIRAKLARKHGAASACPITTGIFAWIAAHAAQEAVDAGAKTVTPYWRTLKSGGELNPKYPGGAERIAALLLAEGHEVALKGKRHVVLGYEQALVSAKR